MALVVEDGSGLANAESLASVDHLKSYAKSRGLSAPSSTPRCEQILRLGIDAMRGLDYIGERFKRDQALDWPRESVYVDGFYYPPSQIPRDVIDAQCEMALAADTTDLLPVAPANASGPVTEETIGPITITYAAPIAAADKPVVHRARTLLRKYICGGFGSMIRVTRG